MLPVRPNKDSDDDNDNDNDRSEDSNPEPSVASKQAVVGPALSGMALSLEMGLWCCLCVFASSRVCERVCASPSSAIPTVLCPPD